VIWRWCIEYCIAGRREKDASTLDTGQNNVKTADRNLLSLEANGFYEQFEYRNKGGGNAGNYNLIILDMVTNIFLMHLVGNGWTILDTSYMATSNFRI
jgi:hypothetical protein